MGEVSIGCLGQVKAISFVHTVAGRLFDDSFGAGVRQTPRRQPATKTLERSFFPISPVTSLLRLANAVALPLLLPPPPQHSFSSLSYLLFILMLSVSCERNDSGVWSWYRSTTVRLSEGW